MTEYTPTERLRDVITDYADDFMKPDHQRMTRWPEVEEALAAHDRAVKAEAWWEGVYAQWQNRPVGQRVLEHDNPYKDTP